MTTFTVEHYTRAIVTQYPELLITSISLLGAGWANRVCVVNNTLVFRFPRHVTSEQQFLRELRVLPILLPDVPLPIPDYTYIALHRETYPFAFGGYERIPGVALPHPSQALRQATWWRAPAGAFLTALHRISIEHVMTAGVEGYPTAHAWREALIAKHDPFERVVFPLLSPPQRHAIRSYLKQAVCDDRMVAFSPVVLHQDFDLHNLLVDLDTQQVTGVIDFGSLSIGDPAVDVSSALHPYYDGTIDVGWDFRRAYYTRTSALEDLVYLCTCEHEIPQKDVIQARKLLEIAKMW